MPYVAGYLPSIDRLKVAPAALSATAITSATTTQLSTGDGRVSHVLVWDAGTNATVDVYDHASGNNNKLWGWVTAHGVGTFALQLPIANGIRVVTGGTFGGITVVWDAD